MRGKVKWFSKEKGNGYILGDDNQDYHFHVRNLNGTDLPDNGDSVSFEPSTNKRGIIAIDVRILLKNNTSNSSQNSDPRVTCVSCRRKITPRVITYKPTFHLRGTDLPKKTICPYCGADYMHLPSNSGCYIATAAYGSPYAAEVDTFRDFRDAVLVKSWFGRAFIAFYYKTSPPLADFIAEREYLKAATRKWLLAPLLHFLRKK